MKVHPVENDAQSEDGQIDSVEYCGERGGRDEMSEGVSILKPDPKIHGALKEEKNTEEARDGGLIFSENLVRYQSCHNSKEHHLMVGAVDVDDRLHLVRDPEMLSWFSKVGV